MLGKVRSQWEYFIVAMSEMTCMKHESAVGEYAVTAQGHAYECNDFLWSCSCLFYCSYNLACQHLMYIAARIHKFESMPVLSIPPRRDMTEMESMEEDLLRGVLSIQVVQENMKITGDSYGHDGLTQPTDGDDAFEAPDEALVQVKGEQAKPKAILKATHHPVVEHLAGLSSPSFYAALKSWRKIVNKGMKQVGSMPANVTVPPDGSDHETTSDITPADLIDSMNMICELEQNEKVDPSRYCHLAADASAKIGKEECQETIKEKVVGDEKSYPAKISLTERHLTDELDESKGSCKSTRVVRAHGHVEVIRFPKPKARHNRRKKAKQTLLKSSLKPRKLAVMSLPDKQVPSLCRVLEWASHTTDRFHVSELLNNYHSLVTKLEAVLEAEKMKRSGSKYFDNVSEADHPEGTTETLLAFSPGAVYRMKASYSLRKKCEAWLADMDWILSTKWDTLLATPELFDEETNSDELLPSTAGVKHKELATEVATVLGGVNPGSILRLTSREGAVKVDQLVAMLARDRMLSDIIMDFSLRCIYNTLADCYALVSFAPTMGYALPPKERISRFNYIVLSVHLNGIHWGIIIVSLTYHGNPIITPYYYEPLCSQAYRATMENVYEETMVNFIRGWHNRTMPMTEFPAEEPGVWIDSPRQPDGTSCGVLCIAQAYDILKDFFRLARTGVTADDIAVMRLRIM
ncbi:Hypothetical protein PHPALM_6551 [Phytophthora palmivora]|uniref:SWIM-type domain-containing protein n=1 Tax=Phytophthora palmivora TaxID=4796 RepID=A0A2P4YEK3_9STRA|nr:Hypothetical protein PHPALM_6551 [Phytophthora palmivora]